MQTSCDGEHGQQEEVSTSAAGGGVSSEASPLLSAANRRSSHRIRAWKKTMLILGGIVATLFCCWSALRNRRPATSTLQARADLSDTFAARTAGDAAPFPSDFVWGVATSSYQIEGAVNEDGRGETIWDAFVRIPGTILDNSTGDVADDHYHRWREDVALMKELGVKAYRFSIAWSRILPQGRGDVNLAGIRFYDRLIDELLDNDIEPWITLFHWDLPQALQDDFGGWLDRQCVDAFVEYARVVFQHFASKVQHFITLNEPWT